MGKRFNTYDIIKCPHCAAELEGTAEDYVVPGRMGTRSAATDTCYECYEDFVAYKDDGGKITVTTVEEFEDL